MPHKDHVVVVKGEKVVIPDVATYQDEQTKAAHKKIKAIAAAKSKKQKD
jgi:hypothetical protein